MRDEKKRMCQENKEGHLRFLFVYAGITTGRIEENEGDDQKELEDEETREKKGRWRRRDDGDEGTTGKRGRGEEDKEDGSYVCCKYVGSAYVLSMLSLLFVPRGSFIVTIRVLPFLFTICVFVSLTRLKTLWSISNYPFQSECMQGESRKKGVC